MARNVFRATTLVELVRDVFTHEGWQFKAGENRSKRLTDAFDVTSDHRSNKFVARRRDAVKPAKMVGIRETIDYLACNAPQTSELGDDDLGYDVMIVMTAHLFERQPREVYDMIIARRELTGEQ